MPCVPDTRVCNEGKGIGMAGRKNTDLIMYGELEERYGIRRLVTGVATRSDAGDVRGQTCHYHHDPATHYVGLQVTAYLSPQETGAYGFHVGYRSVGGVIELDQMEDQIRVLRRIKRGMAEAAGLFGYPAGYAAYVCHVAHALRVVRFAHRRTKEQRELAGTWVSETDAAGFHHWVRYMERQYTRQPVDA